MSYLPISDPSLAREANNFVSLARIIKARSREFKYIRFGICWPSLEAEKTVPLEPKSEIKK